MKKSKNRGDILNESICFDTDELIEVYAALKMNIEFYERQLSNPKIVNELKIIYETSLKSNITAVSKVRNELGL